MKPCEIFLVLTPYINCIVLGQFGYINIVSTSTFSPIKWIQRSYSYNKFKEETDHWPQFPTVFIPKCACHSFIIMKWWRWRRLLYHGKSMQLIEAWQAWMMTRKKSFTAMPAKLKCNKSVCINIPNNKAHQLHMFRLRLRKQTIQLLQCLHVRGMGETCCCLHDKQLLVTMLMLKKTSATICHYLAMLKRQATQHMSTKEHVGTRVTLALGITILQELFFERKMLIENPKQDPNTQLVDQKQIQHSHHQLVPMLLEVPAWLGTKHNNTL